MLQYDVQADNESRMDKEWPRNGKLIFTEYTASYRPGVLRDVLTCVTFTVEPGERVTL